MKSYLSFSLVLVLGMMMVSVVLADTPPAVPATPAAVDGVLYARPFTLAEGYTFEWRKERQQFTEGTILVLKVKPDFVYPRQTEEPVLFVGNQTAERINVGFKSGHVIVVVPGTVDLATTPIWFGTPQLPERVDADIVRAERVAADNAGVKPIAADEARAAEANGGARLELTDRVALLREIAPLITQYAPDEQHLADAFLVPVTR
jgi:hypothetical protein